VADPVHRASDAVHWVVSCSTTPAPRPLW
jgi:hypothetical protein